MTQDWMERGGKIFLDLATDSLKAAAENIRLKKFPQSVQFSMAAIEYSFKAASRYVSVPIGKTHDVAEQFGLLLRNVPNLFRTGFFEFIEVGSAIQTIRELSEYGIPDSGVSPDDIFDENKSKAKLALATQAYGFCCKIIRGKTLSKRNMRKVGILNGAVNDPHNEVVCGAIKSPYTKYSKKDWIDELRNKGYDCEDISISSISEKYALILNPFGEEYPETDLNKLSSFYKIGEYISKGGVFACAGGLPFWYAWLTPTTPTGVSVTQEQDRRIPIFDRGTAIISSIKVEGEKVIVETAAPLYSGLYGKMFFGVEVTGGNPAPVQIEEDHDFYGLLKSWEQPSISEFRATVRSAFLPIIPVVHATRGELCFYPIAAVSYMLGYLVSAGINLDEDPDGNALKTIVTSVDMFLKDRQAEKNAFKRKDS